VPAAGRHAPQAWTPVADPGDPVPAVLALPPPVMPSVATVVAAGGLPAMKRAFEKAHKARFGFIDRSKQMVVEAVSVEAVGGGVDATP